ncbi:S-layer homology domain-containing protein [Candidatus Margulisiibacteriota bacterium]
MHWAYPSIVSLIRAGYVPEPKDNTELFEGEDWVTRKEAAALLYFVVKRAAGSEQKPPAAEKKSYPDVPAGHYAADDIAELLEAGILTLHAEKKFKGGRPVTRYQAIDLLAQLLEQVLSGQGGLKQAAYDLRYKDVSLLHPAYLDYGFDFSMSNTASLAQGNLTQASASQLANIAFDRSLGNTARGYVNLRGSYNFGQTTAINSSITQAYLVYNADPFHLQAGRFPLYETYDPFGNSIFVDSLQDMVVVEGSKNFGRIMGAVSKLVNVGILQDDSKAGLVLYQPELPLELSLGFALVTDPTDPSGAYSSARLPCNITQLYIGVRVPANKNVTLTLEGAQVSLSNEETVLPYIGFTNVTDTKAYQASISFITDDLKNQYSLGYQNIGEDYYMAELLDPAALVGGGQGTSAYLYKWRNYINNREHIGVGIEYIMSGGENLQNKINLLYSRRMSDQIYSKATVTRTDVKTAGGQGSWDITGLLAAYF